MTIENEGEKGEEKYTLKKTERKREWDSGIVQ